MPYFSRRIGLVGGQEVPIIAGGKVNGRMGGTNFGGLAVGTRPTGGRRRPSARSWRSGASSRTSGASRGSARSRPWAIRSAAPGSWLGGADFTYATSRFRGDKNFLVGVWGLATGRQDLGSDATAHGFKIDYPNDSWDMALTYKRIGRDFDPSLGFVPRRAVQLCDASVDYSPRLARGPVQQMFVRVSTVDGDRSGGPLGELPDVLAPVNWRFRSGDRVEFNVNPTGERLVEPFEVDDGVVDPAGPVPMAAISTRSRHGAEAAALRAGHLVVRRFLRRRARPVRVDRRVEPEAARHGRVLRRAQHRTARDRQLHADARRHAAARQHLAGPVDRELHPVRHR